MLETGDIVEHKPTGEQWLVAFADYASGEMSWIGYPEGTARIEDCKLVKKANKEDRQMYKRDLLKLGDSDLRGRYAAKNFSMND